MFSNVLTSYQSCVITFLEKSSRALGAVSKTFYGYQPYEFSVIKVSLPLMVAVVVDTPVANACC